MDNQSIATGDNYSAANDNTDTTQPTVDGLGTPPSNDPIDDLVNEPMSPALDSSTQATSTGIQDTSPSEPTPPSTPTASATPAGTDLQDIKHQALDDLTPLLTDLDQTPEEHFKTMMMLIQASDNQDLIKDAYAAAAKITDVKVRAQALLDIVNEINYFTQKP